MTQEGVFVRKATGLVREIGLIGAILFCMTFCIQIFSGPLELTYWVGYGNLSINWWLAWAIVLVISLLVNSVYAHFSSAMPRSGGDYVFLSRTIHPLVGFIPSWSFYWVDSVWNAFNLLFAAGALPLFFATFMQADAVAPLYTVGGQFAIAFIVWLIGFFSLTGMRNFLRGQSIMWVVTIVGIAVSVFYFLNAIGSFTTLFNSWSLQYVPTEPDMYHKILNDAIAAGYNANPPPEGPNMGNTLSFVVTVVGSAVPYQAAIMWVAGEVKKADSGVRQHIAMETTAVVSVVLYIAMMLPWVLAAGGPFTGAFIYLGGAIEGLPTSGFIWSIFPAIMPSWAIALFSLTIFITSIIVYTIGMIICSRLLFAWSFDRLAPSIFARVSDRYHTPWVSMIATSFVGLFIAIFMLLTPGGFWTYMGAIMFLVLINVFIACVAGVVFPFLRKEMYEQMPLKARIAGIPVLSIISLVAAVLLGWVATGYFTNPAYLASLGITQSMVGMAALIWVVGIVLYFVSRAYRKSQGIDLGIAFRQIPPA